MIGVLITYDTLQITIKECCNEDAQCSFVVDKILEISSDGTAGKSSFGDIAILFRRQVKLYLLKKQSCLNFFAGFWLNISASVASCCTIGVRKNLSSGIS